MYFESKKSGGDDVDEVQMFQDKGYCLVTFDKTGGMYISWSEICIFSKVVSFFFFSHVLLVFAVR
jgi:hypothetical protein